MPRQSPKGQIEKYNLMWSPATDPLWMEIKMIQKGGRWKETNDEMVGNGLEFHFKAALKIAWPHLVFHKWTDLFIENFLSKRTVVVIGPASSGKTAMAAFCVLMDYYCYPDTTTVICTSTTRERLEDRVWGEIKKLHKIAKKGHSWIPGHLIEGRQRIITDNRDESTEGRDFRCFPKGTNVDTPFGPRQIQNIKTGDLVYNACGVGKVAKTFQRFAPQIIRVILNDGRQLDCTPEHPLLTQRGWVKAVDLLTFDMVFSAHETLSLLRASVDSRIPEPKILQCRLSDVSSTEEVRTLQERVQTVESKIELDWKKQRQILRTSLLGNVGRNTQRAFQNQDWKMRTLREPNESSSFLSEILFSEMSEKAKENALRAVRKGFCFDNRQAENATFSILRSGMQTQSDRGKELKTSRETDKRGIGCLVDVSPKHISLPCDNRLDNKSQPQALVSTGHCVSEFKTGGGNRRWGTSNSEQGHQGCDQNENFGRAWVDSVEVLESSSDPRFDAREDGYRVYNIAVEGHPSYSVNGVVVHNCGLVGVPTKKGESYVGLSDFAGLKNKRVILLGDELSLLPRVFVDAISNLDKNPKFLCIGLGNPKDTTDALGVLAEPAAYLGGWDGGIDQSPFTKVWDTRRPQGVCLQLVGSDSPNLDGKLGIPLLTQEQIDRDVAFYGTDSLWYTMMNQGMMPRGQGSRRVITRQMCEKFGARNEPTWLNSTRTQIAFLDAAYRGVGGDRCVFGVLEYGEEMPTDAELPSRLVTALVNQPQDEQNKRKILHLKETSLVPISNDIKEMPEDQIVAFVMRKCTEFGIPPENFYYDSGMRTSLVQAFSRLWSNKVNSVDCGGKPSERKVSYDIDVLCRDHYSKFITELWFNVRHVIEAGQFRGMTDDVMLEFASREWTLVGNNKTEVEPKDKMKSKAGRSPDLADAVAVGVWGAIQKGFVIRRLLGDKRRQMKDDRWKREMKEKAGNFWKAGQMVTTP